MNRKQRMLDGPGCFADRSKTKGASLLAKIAVGLVRLDYSAEIVQHADLCLLRARQRAVPRVRDRVTDRVWPCIPDWPVSKPIADQINAIPALPGTDFVNVAVGGSPNAVLAFSFGYHIAPRRCKARARVVSRLITPSSSTG